MSHLILGIESSCDDTAVAVLEGASKVRASIVRSQFDVHEAFGGVVPEMASRTHMQNMLPVVENALQDAACSLSDLDAIAVTGGPGLIGSLLVGGHFGAGLAYALKKPLISVHHIEGHVYSAFLSSPDLRLPAICLVVSGGHTHLYYLDPNRNLQCMGRTQDDAAGEAFDKVAKLMGLGFPGGPALEAAAQNGNPQAIRFPRAKMPGLDFSFSGIKTAVAYYVRDHQQAPDFSTADVAASFQAAVSDTLADGCKRALDTYPAQSLILVGGVARNQSIRSALAEVAREKALSFVPADPQYCTDNAAMIAAAAYPKFLRRDFVNLSFEPKSTLALG